MPTFETADVRGLLAALLLCGSGCSAHWCHLPDDCAHAFAQTQLGWEISDVCDCCPPHDCGCGVGFDCSCGEHVYDDAVWLDEPRQPRRPRISVGPPPVPYEPPMPPQFLPVPARSVFSNVNLNAPTIANGQVEVGYGPELAFPSGD